jgi:FKBP-type peptidyl-prolyl cis-trans isomerase
MKGPKNFIFIVALAVIGVGAIGVFGLGNSNSEQASVKETLTTNKEKNMDLKVEDLVVGQGPEAKCGNTVTAHYTGWLTNGEKFDSSVDRGTPFQFRLCEGQVIKGWDQGILDMKVGGKRKLTIPAELAYGDREVGPIPANSILVFEVELLNVEEFKGEPNLE